MDGETRVGDEAVRWANLPSDALAYIINECGLCQSDVASIRLVCVHWRGTTQSHLKSLAPACTSLEQVAGIAQRFPYLTNCDLTRCDTRLVGHASLCRDASARLSMLLAALSRMPSLTSLHISDTFSERMGQKHWASLVCAQALVDGSQPPVPRTPELEPALETPAAEHPAAPAHPYNAVTEAWALAGEGGSGFPALNASTSGSSVAVAARLGTALAALNAGCNPGASSAASSSRPDKDSTAAAPAVAGTDSSGGGGSNASCAPGAGSADRDGAVPPAPASATSVVPGSAPPAMSGSTNISGSRRRMPATEGGQLTAAAASTVEKPECECAGTDDGRAACGAARGPDTVSVAAPDADAVVAVGVGTRSEAEPSSAGAGGAGPIVREAAAGEAEPAAAAPPPPPPLVLSAAELADPGIKSFARAISRPGATQQHAFWLPDWCGRLSGLQELHIRGRQRPCAGLPPCLLWLHAGRTAPQLTSLSLVRLSLVTLPEQLQHLTALTRLVAQDCSLSVMPRGVAAGLSRLEYLDLSLNGLTALPPDFTQLTALRHLDLQRNKLVSLPADMGRLSLVTCLLLNNNQLRQLPPSLASLSHVEALSCSYNWLGGMGTSLPLLCGLPRLRRLELACVSDVRCRLDPPQELRHLAAHLTHLDLAANNLVPADVLGTLTSLRSLVLSDCGLLAVPPWVRRLAQVTHLDLSNNSLSELPCWLSACTRLRYLSIAHNRLSIRVPRAVMEQMPQLEVVESE